MNCTMRLFWVTIARDRTRTQDIRLMARSAWAAWWLYRQLNPTTEIIHIREAG